MIPSCSRKKKYRNTDIPIQSPPPDTVPATITMMPNHDTRLDSIGIIPCKKATLAPEHGSRVPPCKNITNDLLCNLKEVEPKHKWATAVACIEGDQNNIFTSLRQGTL